VCIRDAFDEFVCLQVVDVDGSLNAIPQKVVVIQQRQVCRLELCFSSECQLVLDLLLLFLSSADVLNGI